MDKPKNATELRAETEEAEYNAFCGIATAAVSQLHDTLLAIMPLGKEGRKNVYLHWWALYLGTLIDELATASLQLLRMHMPRAAIVTIRQVFEYSIRMQYLSANPAEAEKLMDSLQKRVWDEARQSSEYFSKELIQRYEKNYLDWADEHPDLESNYMEGRFTDWARIVLGARFKKEFFRQYSYPSIIAHGKPHGVIDVLEPIGPAQVKHFWDSRTIDELSELSKLAATLIEYIAFIRKAYQLDILDVFSLNEQHARTQQAFGYLSKPSDAN